MIQGVAARCIGQGIAFSGGSVTRSWLADADATPEYACASRSRSITGMCRLGGRWRSLVAIALATFSWPAFAAGFDCSRAADPVEKTICASPKLSELDARLSAVYAAALARNPVRADAFRRDEHNWLGERDDQAWRLLSDPMTASDAAKELMHLYEQRIAFLRHFGAVNEQADSDSPVLHALLGALSVLPKDTQDPVKAMQAMGLVTLPAERGLSNLQAVVQALPAPSSPGLRKVLQQYADASNFTLAYLPSARLGAVYSIGGSADCSVWVVFEKRDSGTEPVKTQPKTLGGCWNTTSHLALLDGYPVAMTETIGIATQDADIQWQRWLADGRWGHAMRLHVRFDRKLVVGESSCDPSLDCDKARRYALQIASLYDRKPLPGTVADFEELNPSERVRFHQMEAFAACVEAKRQQTRADKVAEGGAMASKGVQPSLRWQLTWERKLRAVQEVDSVSRLPQIGKRVFASMDEFGKDASYFPARLDGELVLGRIGHGYIGWRLGGYWMVGFWRWTGDRLVPLAGVVIYRKNNGVLLAAWMKPRFQNL